MMGVKLDDPNAFCSRLRDRPLAQVVTQTVTHARDDTKLQTRWHLNAYVNDMPTTNLKLENGGTPVDNNWSA